jgi:drug/metabolite transporter (DMT)-like permease
MTYIAGILLSTAAAILFGVSTVLQKQAMGRMKKFSLRALLHNRGWIGSLAVGGLGLLFYLEAVSFFDITMIQPMVTASVIIPIIAGGIMFRERLGARKWLAIFIILIGIAAVIF